MKNKKVEPLAKTERSSLALMVNEVEHKLATNSTQNIYFLMFYLCVLALSVWFLMNAREINDSTIKPNILTTGYNFTNLSENNATDYRAVCEQKSVTVSHSEPLLIKSCTLNNFKSVSTGEVDYKGRYAYKYEIFIKKNGAFMKANNDALFNEKKNELLLLINKKIKIVYDKYATNPETKDCFEGMNFKKYSYSDLGIEFVDDKINFNVWFEVYEYCYNVNSTSVSFRLEEIEPYFKTK